MYWGLIMVMNPLTKAFDVIIAASAYIAAQEALEKYVNSLPIPSGPPGHPCGPEYGYQEDKKISELSDAVDVAYLKLANTVKEYNG